MSSQHQPTSSGSADKFLDSLKIPNPNQAIQQLEQMREKLQDTKSILELLQQSLETTKLNLPPSVDREVLINELESNIKRHQILVERESLKLAVKERYVSDVLAIDVNTHPRPADINALHQPCCPDQPSLIARPEP